MVRFFVLTTRAANIVKKLVKLRILAVRFVISVMN